MNRIKKIKQYYNWGGRFLNDPYHIHNKQLNKIESDKKPLRSITFALSYFLLRFSIVLTSKKRCTQKNDTILFLEIFPVENAGYQYRAKKWSNLFNEKGIKTEVWTIFDNKKEYEELASNAPKKFLRKAMWIRFKQIKASKPYKKVIVRRELLQYNDYGNLFMEKLLLKFHPNAILDFDDDISAAKNEPRHVTSLFGKLLKENGLKFTESLKQYSNFIPGSNYLNQLITEKRGNSNFKSIVIPTCVDYDKHPPKEYNLKENNTLKFGWIGTNGNLLLLEQIIPELNLISKTHSIELIVISGQEFKPNADFPIINIAWSLETEIENIKKIDIGLMPLIDNIENRGKCGFKLIQYMGLGIVCIADDLTVNKEIIKANYSFLVSQNNWNKVLNKVISLKANYQELGNLAKVRIENNYTFNANLSKYIQFTGK